MEQSIWLYAGVVSALFGIVIIGTIIIDMQEKAKTQELENTINKIGQMTDFVCSGDEGMLLSEKVKLASGSKIQANKTKKSICISYANENKCISIKCGINDYELNLDTPEHKAAFNIAEYKCYIEKANGTANIECKG
ncbi:MAG: hypothetical protein QXU92_01940 [Candidatus Diapherotrites archaeon]